MTERALCRRCGTELPAGMQGRECPVCLLGLALEDMGEAEPDTASPASSGVEQLGSIGPYKLLSLLGEGGMGTVYLAAQSAPIRRRVALKLIKRGMDTKEVIARFESERQALALMSHRNIARVLDAGTTRDGLPYFVMEHVAGIPITEYCDKNRLDGRQRLELFSEVCQAVQHAHQKGIIHRDIKPSNVLVSEEDGTPRPRIIDFGIAKAINQQLTEKTLLTRRGVVVGTPTYMSPEQTDPAVPDVDTRTDIYSLGVLLYELVTGVTPFDPQRLLAAGWGEMQRIMREEEPPRPSTRISKLGDTATDIAGKRRTTPGTLKKDLSGELDWITLKALEKDRTRRYQSATELSADISHFLAHEPVNANPPGASYRLQKLVRRNRGAFAAATLLFLVTAVGALVSTTALFRERTARRAERRQLMNLSIANGMRLADEGDHSLALPWLLRASELSESELDRRNNDLRMASVVSQHPKLTALWYIGGRAAIASTSSDAKTLAVVRVDGALQVWDVETGLQEAQVSELLGKRPMALEFSANGRRLIAATREGSVVVWDVIEKRSLTTLHLAPPVFSAALSPDGQLFALGTSEGVQLWDVASVRAVRWLDRRELGARGQDYLPHDPRLVAFSLRGVVFDPSGRYVATTGGDGGAQLWDLRTGKAIGGSLQAGHSIGCLTFSPDGRFLATATMNYLDSRLRIWRTRDGGLERILGGAHDGAAVLDASFNAAGDRIATSSDDQTAVVWNVGTGEQLSPPIRMTSNISTVILDKAGELVLTAAGDGTVRSWRARSGEPVTPLLRHRSPPRAVGWNDTRGSFVVCGEDGVVRGWDVAAIGVPFQQLPQSLQTLSAEFTDDGDRVLLGGGWIWGGQPLGIARVWDANTGEAVTPVLRHASLVRARLSYDEKRVVTYSYDGTARIWDASSGEPLFDAVRHTNAVNAAAVSRSGLIAVSVAGTEGDSSQAEVRFWNGLTGAELFPPVRLSGSFQEIFLSPDDARALTSNWDGTAQLWDLKTGRPVGATIRQADSLYAAVFSPDGSLIATACKDGTARLWRASDGSPVSLPMVHSDGVLVIVFDSQGRRVLTGSSDGSARVWEVPSGRPLTPFVRHKRRVAFVTFGSDEREFFTSSDDGTARLWDSSTGEPLTAETTYGGGLGSAMSQDGNRFAGAYGNSVSVWSRPRWTHSREQSRDLVTVLSAQRSGTDAQDALSPRELLQVWSRVKSETAELVTRSRGESHAWERSRALFHMDRGDLALAEAHAGVALALLPSDLAMRAIRGRSRALIGGYAEAETDLAVVRQSHPADEAAAFALAAVRVRRNNDRGAAEICEEELRRSGATRNPDRARWTARLCSLVDGVGPAARANAVVLARTAMAIEPEHPERIGVVGAALYRAGDFDGAIRELERAVRAGPGEVRSYAVLALALQARGRNREALAWLKRAESVFRRSEPLGGWSGDGELWSRILETEVYLSEARRVLGSPSSPDRLGPSAACQRPAVW